MYIDLVTINLCPQGGGGVKPSGSLDIVENGVYNVYSYSSANVDVHPSASLSETYISNGSYNITGEFNGGSITINVHPSESLSKTYISNGSYNITGEFNGGVITVDVPAPQFITETLNVSANGTYTPGQGVDGYSQVVVDVPIDGWDQKSATEGAIKIINLDNSASFVASSAFQYNNTIQTVNLPNCTSVGAYAFYDCNSLSQVSLPVCSYIGENAFYDCNSLSQISLPVCSYIGGVAFRNCNSLSQVSLPVCSYIGDYTFYSCSSLSQVSLPVCSRIGDNAFRYCSSLSQVSLPVCSRIGDYAFYSCSSLSQVSLPVCSRIGDYAFYSCTNLSTVIIRNSEVCSISNATFSYTLLSKGYVYVPESLVSAYQVANNWSQYSSRIFPIPKDLEFRNGLVYGWATYLDPGYLNELGITAPDVTSVSMSLLTSISSSTFMNHYNMISYDIPNLIEYPDDAFNGCSSLSELHISIPVGNRAFANCTGLTVVNIENTNGIIPAGSDIFSNCNNLSLIYVPDNYYESYISADGWSEYSSLMFKSIPKIAFSNGLVYGSIKSIDSTYTTTLNINKDDVISVDLINCENVGLKTFYSNQQLTQVNLPECVSLGVNAFAECIRLQTISLPKCEYIGDSCFQGAFQSNTTGYDININLPVCSYIGNSAFYWTQRSLTLTLGYDGVVDLPSGSHTFEATTVRSIYVPASLVDAYKSATNWSLYSTKIFPIPE